MRFSYYMRFHSTELNSLEIEETFFQVFNNVLARSFGYSLAHTLNIFIVMNTLVFFPKKFQVQISQEKLFFFKMFSTPLPPLGEKILVGPDRLKNYR